MCAYLCVFERERKSAVVLCGIMCRICYAFSAKCMLMDMMVAMMMMSFTSICVWLYQIENKKIVLILTSIRLIVYIFFCVASIRSMRVAVLILENQCHQKSVCHWIRSIRAHQYQLLERMRSRINRIFGLHTRPRNVRILHKNLVQIQLMQQIALSSYLQQSGETTNPNKG